MISPLEIILTFYFWLVASIATIITFVACVLVYPFVSQKTFSRTYETIMGFIVLNAMALPGIWSFKIKDLRTLNKRHFNNRSIYIANHASFIDTLLVTQIPTQKKYIMAKIFTKIPVFGWLCKTSGHVPVDMHDRSTTEPALHKSVQAMRDGCSFMIFPEGKRSKDPYSLLPFKTGAFRLSQETGVPITPMVVRGTGECMPIGGICRPGNLEIVIGHSFSVGKGRENLEKSIKRSREFMEIWLSERIN